MVSTHIEAMAKKNDVESITKPMEYLNINKDKSIPKPQSLCDIANSYYKITRLSSLQLPNKFK